MTTTLYAPAPYTAFVSNGYRITQTGTAVPDNLVQAIVAAVWQADGVLLTSSAGGVALVQVPSYYNPGIGPPSGGDTLPVGAELRDSVGDAFEKAADGTWTSAQSVDLTNEVTRADAAYAPISHLTASDPHGDRAYADTQLALLPATFMRLDLGGAKGDGVTDDRAAINAVLAAAPTGSTVVGDPKATYLIGSTTTASSFAFPSGTPQSVPVGLRIPSGVTLDLRGATLKMGTGTDAVMVTNSGCATNVTTDTDVGLINAVLNGNGAVLTRGLLTMLGVTRLKLRVKVKNLGGGLGVWLNNISHGDIDIDADTVAGQPIALGQNSPTGNEMKDCTFGLLRSANTTPDPANTFNRPGNGMAGVFLRSTIDKIETRNCSAGIKLDALTSDVVIGRIYTDSCGDSVGNSGVKLQGNSTNAVTRVTIGEIEAKGQSAHGLYMEYTVGCHVGKYTGYANQTLGTGPDVWLGGSGDSIGALRSNQAGADGAQLRSYASDVQLGLVNILDPGAVSGSSPAFNAAGSTGSCSITDLVAADDRGTSKMTAGLFVAGAAQVRCPSIKVSGWSVAATQLSSATATSISTILSGTPTFAQALPAGASTSPADIRVYTSGATWTKPTWALVTTVAVIGGGGGGGSGARRATATQCSGGGGGGGGGWASATFSTAELNSTETVSVGAAGTGAASVTTDDTNGAAGGSGGASVFGGKVRAQPGSGGGAGGTSASSSGSGGSGMVTGGNGGSGALGGVGAGGGTGNAGAPGGGAGAGLATSPAQLAGGVGGTSVQLNSTGGGAGGTTGNGTAGTSVSDLNLAIAGSAGGGGASSISGAAGNGGAGGSYGGGGGGGGAALNGNASGAGGAAGPGIVVVVSR